MPRESESTALPDATENLINDKKIFPSVNAVPIWAYSIKKKPERAKGAIIYTHKHTHTSKWESHFLFSLIRLPWEEKKIPQTFRNIPKLQP